MTHEKPGALCLGGLHRQNFRAIRGKLGWERCTVCGYTRKKLLKLLSVPIIASPTMREDEIYIIDNQSHVHVFHYEGRLVDPPEDKTEGEP